MKRKQIFKYVLLLVAFLIVSIALAFFNRFVLQDPMISAALKWMVAGVFVAGTVCLCYFRPFLKTKRWISGLRAFLGIALACAVGYGMDIILPSGYGEDGVPYYLVFFSVIMISVWCYLKFKPKKKEA